MKLNYEAHRNDLYAKFNCVCTDPKWKDSNASHLFKTKITLVGYDDDYFFDSVNEFPRKIECQCGICYNVQWFRDHVEVNKEIKNESNS